MSITGRIHANAMLFRYMSRVTYSYTRACHAVANANLFGQRLKTVENVAFAAGQCHCSFVDMAVRTRKP
jgi:hypothetical protein